MTAIHSAGFGIAETLIAAAIAGVVLGGAYQLIASNAQAARLTADRRTAILVAQSALEQASIGRSPALPRRGRDGDFAWSVRIKPFRPSARRASLPIEHVEVSVSRIGVAGPLLQLRSLRIRPR